jgi:hypothetical protein
MLWSQRFLRQDRAASMHGRRRGDPGIGRPAGGGVSGVDDVVGIELGERPARRWRGRRHVERDVGGDAEVRSVEPSNRVHVDRCLDNKAGAGQLPGGWTEMAGVSATVTTTT